jgi:hypothetical protein
MKKVPHQFRDAAKLIRQPKSPRGPRILHAGNFNQNQPMKTRVTISTIKGNKSFIANGRPSDVSDRIVRIKRAFNLRQCHGVQAIAA